MVHLILSSTKGNQGLRYFPHIGYLGLTPIRVEGVVRTKLDDDARSLLAKSLTISVRCYESRLGRVSVLHSNVLVDYTQVLWSKPDGDDYAPIDEVDYPFRITIPTRVGGFSTTVFVDYRCMWRVEAVLTHIPLSGVGSRQIKHFELPLTRYNLPPYLPPSPSPPRPLLTHQTTKHRAPRIRYDLIVPTNPIGPLDIVSVLVHLLPMESNTSIRSVTLMIERRIGLREAVAPSFPPDIPPPSPLPISNSSNSSSPRASPASSISSSDPNTPATSRQSLPSDSFIGSDTVISEDSSNPTITPYSVYSVSSSFASDRPLLPASPTTLTSHSSTTSFVPFKTVVTPIVGAESTGHFSRDSQGLWSKTVTLQWPAAKSHSRWAIGETIQSELVSVQFFARVKISVSSPNGTESIELSEKELVIVSTNEGERQIAIDKYNELINNQMDKARSKSKSPRRTKRDPEFDLPPPPTPSASSSRQTGSGGSIIEQAFGQGSSSSSKRSGKVSTPRRPHTSAGPRDRKMFDFSGMQARFQEPEYDTKDVLFSRQPGGPIRSTPLRSETSHSESAKRKSGVVGSLFSSTSRMAAGSGNFSRSTSSSIDKREASMREWEAELAKIEMVSRRTSDMLGFAFKRKRSSGAPRGEA